MNQKNFNLIAGVAFSVIALIQLVRSILGWEVYVNNLSIPAGVSVVAFLVATFFAYSAFKFNNKENKQEINQ